MAATDPFQTPTASTATTQQATSQGYQAATYDPTKTDGGTADATYRTVQPNELVQNQLKGIIDENSPLLQQARSRAMDTANSRGLINSTMAAQSGQAALYDYALPIAQQDATSYQTAARDNQGVANSTSQFNAGLISGAASDNAAAANQASQFGATAANSASQFNATQANTQSQFNADSQNKMALATLDGNIRQNLMELESTYKNQMQSSQSASEMYKQSISAIQQIQNNPEFDQATKTTLMNQQLTMLRQGMEVAQATTDLNLGRLINWSYTTPQASAPEARQGDPATGGTAADPITQRFNPSAAVPANYSGGYDAFGNPTWDWSGG